MPAFPLVSRLSVTVATAVPLIEKVIIGPFVVTCSRFDMPDPALIADVNVHGESGETCATPSAITTSGGLRSDSA